jgi:hypothetical protein
MPTAFDHIPDPIRNFVVVRPRWPGIVEHRVRCCYLRHITEWRSSSENLSQMSGLYYTVQIVVRTSQATTPKPYISPAFVGSDESSALSGGGGRIDSGVLLRESRATPVPHLAVQTVEWGNVDALPRPAIWGVPPLSISTFV